MVRSLGATQVIDYSIEDFTRGKQRYDLVIDIAGGHSLAACRRVMKAPGAFVGVGAAAIQHKAGGTFRAFGHFLSTRIISIGGHHRVTSLFIADLRKDDLDFLAGLLASGEVVPAIDRRYELARVPEALQYIDEGHARAKVAVTVSADE
jgi:NADPH:quinone reductase-like Zn-dependent oxidoreductase